MKLLKRSAALFLTIGLCFTLFSCGKQPEVTPTPVEPTSTPTPVPRYTEATILFAGDTLVHNPQLRDALAQGDGKSVYNFLPCMIETQKYVEAADYAIINLETTLANTGVYQGYPTFNTPVSYAEALKAVGFDMCTTANNHSYDSTFSGLCDTLDNLDKVGLEHIGTYRTQEEYDANHGVVVKDINDIRVAFLDYTYGLNGFKVSEENSYAVNLFNTDYTTTCNTPDYARLDADMAYVKTLDVDCFIVLIHWGVEYQLKENSYQDEMADYFISNGALAVIGGHSHTPQPLMERTVTLKDGTTRTGFVCYSLGNFTSNQMALDKKGVDITGLLHLNLKMDFNTGIVELEDVYYVPYLNLRISGYPKSDYHYILLDAYDMISQYENGTAPSYITKSIYQQLKDCVADCSDIFGAEYDVKNTTKVGNAA